MNKKRYTAFQIFLNGLHGNEVSVQKCHLDDRYERNECGLGSLVHREFTDTARLLD